MAKSSSTMMIVLLVVGLAIGGGIGYFAAPPKIVEKPGQTVEVTVTKAPLEGKTVKIGNIISTTAGVETGVPWADEICEVDLNEFADKLGYDITFDILSDNAEGQAAIHLEKTQSFKAMDVNLVHGGGWSSFASASLSYVNENNILLWSSSSTSPTLRIADDNLYRMCPDDMVQAPAIAKMLWSWGIKAIIVIQRADSWADGIYNILVTEYPALGGVIAERIRYAGEVTEFSSYLAQAESKAQELINLYGEEHVAIETISFSESVTQVTQARDYPLIYNLMWFGSDGTAMTTQHLDDAPEESDHLKIFSTYAAPGKSEKFFSLFERNVALVGQPIGYYTACSYDVYFTFLKSVLEAQSMDPKDIIPLQMKITYDTWGASGWTLLNEAGDRLASNYDIWGYGYDPEGEAEFIAYAIYDGTSGQVLWYAEGETPAGVKVPGVSPPGQ